MATHSIDKILGLYDSLNGNGQEVFSAVAKASKDNAIGSEALAMLDTAIETQETAPLIEWLTVRSLLPAEIKCRYPEVEEMRQAGVRNLPDVLARYPRKVVEDLRERALLDLCDSLEGTEHDLAAAVITFNELLAAYTVDKPSAKRFADSAYLGVIEIETDMQNAVASVLRNMAANDNLLVL